MRTHSPKGEEFAFAAKSANPAYCVGIPSPTHGNQWKSTELSHASRFSHYFEEERQRSTSKEVLFSLSGDPWAMRTHSPKGEEFAFAAKSANTAYCVGIATPTHGNQRKSTKLSHASRFSRCCKVEQNNVNTQQDDIYVGNLTLKSRYNQHKYSIGTPQRDLRIFCT